MNDGYREAVLPRGRFFDAVQLTGVEVLRERVDPFLVLKQVDELIRSRLPRALPRFAIAEFALLIAFSGE